MPNNRNRRRRNQQGRSNATAGASVQVLKDIRNELMSQSSRPVPMVQDVQIMKLARNRTCSFAGNYDALSIVTSNTNPQTYAIVGRLDAIAGYTELASAFDQYRILQMVLVFEPRNPVVALGLGATIHTAIDYDDADISGFTALVAQQYDNVLTVPVGTFFQRVFNPRIAYAAFGSGAFTSYANQRAGWIDVASPAVQHYGLKIHVTQTATANAVYDIKAKVFIQFRAQR